MCFFSFFVIHGYEGLWGTFYIEYIFLLYNLAWWQDGFFCVNVSIFMSLLLTAWMFLCGSTEFVVVSEILSCKQNALMCKLLFWSLRVYLVHKAFWKLFCFFTHLYTAGFYTAALMRFVFIGQRFKDCFLFSHHQYHANSCNGSLPSCGLKLK